MILILLLAIIVIPNIILTINNMIPFNITIISTLLIIIVALPIIVLDIKNDLDIKNIHQYSFLPKMWFFRREYFLCGEKAVLPSKFGTKKEDKIRIMRTNEDRGNFETSILRQKKSLARSERSSESVDL